MSLLAVRSPVYTCRLWPPGGPAHLRGRGLGCLSGTCMHASNVFEMPAHHATRVAGASQPSRWAGQIPTPSPLSALHCTFLHHRDVLRPASIELTLTSCLSVAPITPSVRLTVPMGRAWRERYVRSTWESGQFPSAATSTHISPYSPCRLHTPPAQVLFTLAAKPRSPAPTTISPHHLRHFHPLPLHSSPELSST